MTQTATASSISPRELAARLNDPQPVKLIDVRTPIEFAEVHAVGARNMPLSELDAAAVGDGPVYVICKSGSRAARACEQLCKAGCGEVFNVEGGTDAWVSAGLPVERKNVGLPLIRQVHLAAGSLVLAGVLLGLLVNPWFYILSGFVGAGLIFAGATGFCGMALLLAKMPWNQGKSCQV